MAAHDSVLRLVEAKGRARIRRRTGRKGWSPPAAMLELAEREKLHPTGRAVWEALWSWSAVRVFRINSWGRLCRPGERGRTLRIRCWTGSIAGLAVALDMPERTLKYWLRRLTHERRKSKCYVIRLQRGRPEYTSRTGRKVPPCLTVLQLVQTPRQVRKLRTTRRQAYERKDC